MPVGRLPTGSLDEAQPPPASRSRNIDLSEGEPQQRIVRRTADNARFLAVAIGHREQACNFAITEPSGIARLRHARHRYFCGTNLPPSMCAGS
jgi:hypothetical protein